VDSSAEYIIGPYLQNRDKRIITKLAKSSSLWERRIAMLTTFHYIKHGDFDWALKVIKILISDEHDLIHKAVGWMLREIGKRDRTVLVEFLAIHHRTMPRTALRYAIQHFDADTRKAYLSGRVE
jgi:3-methyladenine DNA glycosylase AlkD